jgi:hypothetical protein
VPSPSIFVFQEILSNSFATALQGLLGGGVREEVYRILASKGVRENQISSNFDKVIDVLQQVFGECSRVIIHRALRVLYENYNLPVEFSSQEILLDRLASLRDRVIVDHLRPRGFESENAYMTR